MIEQSTKKRMLIYSGSSNSELAKITMERIEDLDNKKTIFTGFVKLDGYTKSIDCVTGAEKGNTPKYKIDQFEKLA